MESLAEQFERQIFKPFNAYKVKKACGVVNAMAMELVDMAIETHDPLSEEDFYDITGNTYTSIGAAAYYKGKPLDVYTVADTEMKPRRKTLKEDQKMLSPFYADFTMGPGGIGDKRAYVAPSGQTSYSGPEETRKILTDMFAVNDKRATWAMKCTTGTKYSKNVAVGLMSKLHEQLRQRCIHKNGIW